MTRRTPWSPIFDVERSTGDIVVGATPGTPPGPPLAGLVAWWDAADTATITESSGECTQIDDKSGNDYHLNSTSIYSGPGTGSRTVNGLNVLDFDGNTIGRESFTPLSTSYTALVVCQSDDVHIGSIWTQSQSGQPYIRLVDVNGSVRYAVRQTVNDNVQINSSSSISSPSIVTISSSPGSPGLITMWIDDVEEGADGDATNPTCDRFYLGYYIRTSPIQPLDGMIGEVIIYDDYLSDDDRDAATAYLADKWGITL